MFGPIRAQLCQAKQASKQGSIQMVWQTLHKFWRDEGKSESQEIRKVDKKMLVVRFAATRKYKNQAKEKQQNGDK